MVRWKRGEVLVRTHVLFFLLDAADAKQFSRHDLSRVSSGDDVQRSCHLSCFRTIRFHASSLKTRSRSMDYPSRSKSNTVSVRITLFVTFHQQTQKGHLIIPLKCYSCNTFFVKVVIYLRLMLCHSHFLLFHCSINLYSVLFLVKSFRKITILLREYLFTNYKNCISSMTIRVIEQ